MRARGDHFTRSAVLLAGSPPEAEDLLQASLLKPYQAGPRLDVTGAAPDAYLRNIPVDTRRSWWRPRWRQGSSAEVVLEVADPLTGMRSVPWCGRLCPGCSTSLSRP